MEEKESNGIDILRDKIENRYRTLGFINSVLNVKIFKVFNNI